jgi:Putative zinc-finger
MRSAFRHRLPKRERLLQQSCPPNRDELAEEYFLGRLPRAAAARFEEHLLVCSQCVLGALQTMAFLEELGRMPPRNVTPGAHDEVSVQ